jgi:hypothetical protein
MPFNTAIILYLAHFLKVEICDFPKYVEAVKDELTVYHEYQLGYLETMKFSLWGLLNLAFSDLFIRRHF